VDEEASWYYRPWQLLLLLFLVLGPVGLPLLWKSPCFTRTWKIVVTGVTLVYTAILVDQIVVVVRMAMDEMAMLPR